MLEKKLQITKEFFKKKKTTAARIRTRGKVHRKMQVARGIWSGAQVFIPTLPKDICVNFKDELDHQKRGLF